MTKQAKIPTIDLAGVGARIDALRIATGMEKGLFAQSCAIDPSSYSKIIQGEKPLKADMAFACAERWGVTMDFLYRGSLDRLPEQYAKTIIAHLTARRA